MATLKNEVKLVKSNEKLTDLIKASKASAKGIFAMHRNVTDLYILDNKEYFEGHKFLTDKGNLNPIVKEIRDKSFKPFNLLFGSLTLDKVLKAINSNDFLSFMELYNKAVLTFIDSDEVEQKRTLERGEEINKAVKAFRREQINGIEFIGVLFEYFPTFYDGLKKGKISPNVAKFLFQNDVETYDKLNIADMYNVELETVRTQVRKLKGVEGLQKFDALIKDGHKVNNILNQFEGVESATTLELAK